jgi:hypothetical protein
MPQISIIYLLLRSRNFICCIARAPTSPAFSGTLFLHAPAIPDFNTVPLPYELVEDAQAILWETAGQFLNPRK